MLKVRVIPTLLWKDVGLVKGVSFDSWRRIGSILPAIKVYNTRQVDELIIVDIIAFREKRDPDFESVADFSSECFVPLTVGGGIRTIEDVKNLLRAGADKVSINSISYEDPELITRVARAFGSQCVVASIDAKKNKNNEYECYSHSGTKQTGIQAYLWAKEMEKRGAGEILLTSIERDGTMKGYDLDLIRSVTDAVKNIPVITSGGAGNYQHMYQALKNKASAVAAASIFHFTQQTPLEAKSFLSGKGIPVRKTRII
ncbi:MAG: imidazole glycerol phosphate synthase subunit HisF [Spirochaetes bacterium]|nr:imidazole glycerol phosphate synthase subunit HisF [Spirochaetota bacterium]